MHYPSPPAPTTPLSGAAAWKFTWLSVRNMLWHHSPTQGKNVVHAKTVTALSTIAAAVPLIAAAIGGPDAAAAYGGMEVASVAAFIPALRYTMWTPGKDKAVYSNPEQNAVLVIRRTPWYKRLVGSQPSWQPDLHIKTDGTATEDVAAFRQEITVQILEAANELQLPLKLTARDKKVSDLYRDDLAAAQDAMGLPPEERREFVVTGKAWPQGEHCAADPVARAATPPRGPQPPATVPGLQGRQPAGIPSGGEFASTRHAESPVELTGPDGDLPRP